LDEEVGIDRQYFLIAFLHADNVVVHAKVVLVVREPDVKKSYPRIKLVGQAAILGLGEPEGPVDAA
jgi:hypothetical protein